MLRVSTKPIEQVGEAAKVVEISEAYFDESQDNTDTVLSVSGYIVREAQIQSFNAAWEAVLKDHRIPYFHMVDCEHETGAFKGRSKEECVVVLKAVIAVIKAHITAGYSVTFELQYANLLPTALTHGVNIVSPYAFCCYWCLQNIRHWAQRLNYTGRVKYIFEAGHAYRGQAEKIMTDIFTHRNPSWDAFYFYQSHAFAQKGEVRGLEAADLLAWQTRKDIIRRSQGLISRKDMVSLLDLRDRYFTAHFDQKAIGEFVEIARYADGK
jgi:hypothetical protein